MGEGSGAAAGATAGLMGVLLSRGPDATLAKGSSLEMVLDRPLQFKASELDFGGNSMRPVSNSGGAPMLRNMKGGLGTGIPGVRIQFTPPGAAADALSGSRRPNVALRVYVGAECRL